MAERLFRSLEGQGQRARFSVLIAFLFICLLGGGASRADVLSLLYVRPAAILCIAAMLVIPGPRDWRPYRTPLLLLGGLAGVMLLQLVPVPPEIWARMPGHAPFMEAARATGQAQPWRSISITPDLTLNSLVSLLVPFAVVVGAASVGRERLYALLPMIIGAATLSVILGIAQLTGGVGSEFYLYAITNDFASVGFFANRNHQALFLAATFPMLGLWAALSGPDPRIRATRQWVALALGVLLVPMILVTGSRAGLILGAAALVLTYLQFRRGWIVDDRQPTARRLLTRFAPWLIVVMVIVATVSVSRAESLRRLADMQNLDDQRLTNLPLFVRMAADFFPLGSGFGSFDPVFRLYEPFEALNPHYLNHAHNDLLEILITGGLFAAILLVIFLGWWMPRGWAAFRRRSAFSRGVAFGGSGSIIIALLLAGSLADYPLRTPTLAALFAIACCWLATFSSNEEALRGSSGDRKRDSSLPTISESLSSR